MATHPAIGVERRRARSRPRHAAREPISNAGAARALYEMSLFLAMDEVPFKPRAYETAAASISAMERPIAGLDEDALREIPGVGAGIAERLHELVTTGSIHELEELRRKHPVDVLALCDVEGVGPKTVRDLHARLGVRTLADLRRAIDEGRVAGIPHYGERRQARLRASLDLWEAAHVRTPLPIAQELAASIVARLRGMPGVEQVEIAGSIRRGRETIGDLDFLIAAAHGTAAARAFASMPEVERVLGAGPTKVLVRLRAGGAIGQGMDADLRIVQPESFGAALLYFTGSKAHAIALRRIALERHMKLNEYGLFRGRSCLASRTEAEIYAALGMDPIPPELREDRGEIEAALAHRLPALIEAGELLGDLHVHTSASDGAHDLRSMVEAARDLGLEYVAITDHTRDFGPAGLTEAQLRAHVRAIRALRVAGIRVLAGAEVNVRPDGSLDVPDALLEELDVVVAGVHARLDQPREAMTERVVRALEHPHVDVLAHPFARVLGRRTPIDVDFDAVLQAARRTGTALEIDAKPDRLDLDAEHARRAVDAGVRIVIGSDAHERARLRDGRELGVTIARRGWARARDVVDAQPASKALAALKGARRRGVR